MNIVLIILLVLYVIGFGILMWKSATNWRWYHILVAVLNLILVITLLPPMAAVLKTRAAWNQMFEKVEQQHETELTAYRELTESPNNVRDLQVELQKLSSESGRVWRNLQLQNVTPQGITLALPADPGAADPAADADDNGAAAGDAATPLIEPQSIVYGFSERELTIGQQTLATPTQYLGEYTVVDSTPNSVTLKSIRPLTQRQQQVIQSGNAGQWSLYELLPLDGHAPFMAEGSQPSDEFIFGRVDQELLQQLFGNQLLPQTIDAYRKDGQSAGEGSELVDSTAEVADGTNLADGVDPAAAAPPPSRNELLEEWSRIQFTEKYTETVDSTENREAVNGGFFEYGLAVDSRLKRIEGPEVSFDAGDEIFVPASVATELRQEGVAEILGNYTVRRLNDYRFVLRRTDLRLDEVGDRIAQLNRQQELLRQQMELTEKMNLQYQVMKTELESDRNQVQTERQAIESYKTKLESDLAETKQQLAYLYKSNLQLTRQLESLHTAIARQTEARVRATSGP